MMYMWIVCVWSVFINEDSRKLRNPVWKFFKHFLDYYSFMLSMYTYIRETNHVSMEYSVAAIL